MATTTRYMQVDKSTAETHDQKLSEVEIHLLDKILNSSSTHARNYAEAYALIKGTLNSTSNADA